MNAAILVLTAWAAGADAAPPAAPAPAPAPVPAYVAPAASPCYGGGCGSTYGGCGTACDCGCEKDSLFTRLKCHLGGLRARFSHSGDCCDPCAEPGFGTRLRNKLSGLFHRNNDCCDVAAPGCGCGTVGYSGAVIATPAAPAAVGKPEPIGSPKVEPPPVEKLPVGPKEKKDGAGKVQVTPRPFATPAFPLTPTSGRSPF